MLDALLQVVQGTCIPFTSPSALLRTTICLAVHDKKRFSSRRWCLSGKLLKSSRLKASLLSIVPISHRGTQHRCKSLMWPYQNQIDSQVWGRFVKYLSASRRIWKDFAFCCMHAALQPYCLIAPHPLTMPATKSSTRSKTRSSRKYYRRIV